MNTSSNIQIKKSSIKGIIIPIDKLKCIAKRFQRLVQILSFLFYSLAILQLIAGSLSVVAHAHENDGLFGDEKTVRTEGIILATFTEMLAGILIILPINSSLNDCKRALMFVNEHIIDKQPLNLKTLRMLTATNTLCFKNPFSYDDCINIKNIKEVNDITEIKKNILDSNV